MVVEKIIVRGLLALIQTAISYKGVSGPKENVSIPVPVIETKPKRPLQETLAREKQGDYCVPCVSSKHLPRVKDALVDAKNIVASEGKFTEVAEAKIQQAVYNLNAAEVDLEQANYPEILKPVVEAMHKETRKLRNFLRVDQSGLEVATVTNASPSDIDKAIESTDALSRMGYEMTKRLVKERNSANSN